MEIAKEIARNAKSLRKSRKMTLQDVSDRSGLAKSYVWEIERGEGTNPSISALLSLCDALGCSLDAIVGRPVYMEPQLRPEAMRIAVQVDEIIRTALRK